MAADHIQPTEGSAWAANQVDQLDEQSLRALGLHPAIDRNFLVECLSYMPVNTPAVDKHGWQAVSLLIRLEAYSAEVEILARLAGTAAIADGWHAVSKMLKKPSSSSGSGQVALPASGAGRYFEFLFDAALDALVDDGIPPADVRPEQLQRAKESGVRLFDHSDLGDLLDHIGTWEKVEASLLNDLDVHAAEYFRSTASFTAKAIADMKQPATNPRHDLWEASIPGQQASAWNRLCRSIS